MSQYQDTTSRKSQDGEVTPGAVTHRASLSLPERPYTLPDQEICAFNLEGVLISDLKLNPNGDKIVIGWSKRAGAGFQPPYDHVALIDLIEGQNEVTLHPLLNLNDRSQRIDRFLFSNNGQALLLIQVDGKVREIDLSRLDKPINEKGYPFGDAQFLDASAGGRFVALSVNSAPGLLNFPCRLIMERSVGGSWNLIHALSNKDGAIAFSKDGKWLAAQDGRDLLLFELDELKGENSSAASRIIAEELTGEAPENRIRNIKFSPDGSRLAWVEGIPFQLEDKPGRFEHYAIRMAETHGGKQISDLRCAQSYSSIPPQFQFGALNELFVSAIEAPGKTGRIGEREFSTFSSDGERKRLIAEQFVTIDGTTPNGDIMASVSYTKDRSESDRRLVVIPHDLIDHPEHSFEQLVEMGRTAFHASLSQSGNKLISATLIPGGSRIRVYES